MKNINWKEVVPPTKHQATQTAFDQAFGTSEVESIEPLSGGRSSALVYKVTAHRKAYVMRIVMEVDELRDPVRHFTALNAASKAGIAPAVRYTSVEDALSIVDFIDHSSIKDGFPSEQELFRELATRIKSIHALPLFPPLVGFLDGVDLLIEQFRLSKVLPMSSTEEVFRYYDVIGRTYPRHEANLVSSHNDFNPTNVLHSNGELWVIDWEVAFANDRYVDLACANIFFGSGEAGEGTLLETYFGDSLSDLHRARFFLMRQVCFMYVAMLFMHLVARSCRHDTVLNPSMNTMRLKEFHNGLRSGEISMGSAEEHLVYAKVMLNESLLQMQTIRFREAITLLESNGANLKSVGQNPPSRNECAQ